jgi:hypothetical protein
MIKHCIIDTNTNTVINIVEYENERTGVPEGLESHLLCVASETGQMGGTYNQDGTITNPPPPEPLYTIALENA